MDRRSYCALSSSRTDRISSFESTQRVLKASKNPSHKKFRFFSNKLANRQKSTNAYALKSLTLSSNPTNFIALIPWRFSRNTWLKTIPSNIVQHRSALRSADWHARRTSNSGPLCAALQALRLPRLDADASCAFLRRAGALLTASFRLRLATAPLLFG